jgi:hypothetical protein
VLRDALRLESRDQTHSAQIRVSSILQGIHRPSNILALNPRCLFNRHLKRVSGVDDYLRHRVRQEIKADRERHLVHKYSSERSRPDTDQPSAPLLYGGPVHSAQRIPEEYWHNDPVTSEWRRSISRLDDKLRTLQETYEALPASNPARATNCA